MCNIKKIREVLLFTITSTLLVYNVAAKISFGIKTNSQYIYTNITDLVKHYGYAIETHTVYTTDGYILNMHRIIKKRERPYGKLPVFLVHGLLCSSMDWVITGPGRSLAFLLVDQDYDVWLANARGNKYSNKHIRYNIFDRSFWDFSWHEIGVYDLPAMINYIIKTTGFRKIFYVGYSQGTTTFFVMLSERPEYNKKIEAMVALSPVVYNTNVKGPFIRALSKFSFFFNFIGPLINFYSFILPWSIKSQIISACRKNSTIQSVCSSPMMLIFGQSEDQLDKELLPQILANTPAGASAKQMIHYAQLVRTENFQQYDYGVLNNWIIYKQRSPPLYKLKNVKVPVALFYSDTDWFATLKDVNKLKSKLPNVVKTYRIQHKTFNHVDFIWAKDVKSVVNDEVINFLNSWIYYNLSL